MTGVSQIDYYLLNAASGESTPVGLLVEEFVLDDDLAATVLRSAGWTAADGTWWSSSDFVKRLRSDAELRSRVVPVDRRKAQTVYHELCAQDLPAEDVLRSEFRDDVVLTVGRPLRLTADTRIQRVLFAGEPNERELAGLRRLLRMSDGLPHPDSATRGVVETGRLRVNDTDFRWDFRRVGGVAWCFDVMSDVDDRQALRWLLRQLIEAGRRHGLIPLTIERFA